MASPLGMRSITEGNAIPADVFPTIVARPKSRSPPAIFLRCWRIGRLEPLPAGPQNVDWALSLAAPQNLRAASRVFMVPKLSDESNRKCPAIPRDMASSPLWIAPKINDHTIDLFGHESLHAFPKAHDHIAQEYVEINIAHFFPIRCSNTRSSYCTRRLGRLPTWNRFPSMTWR